MKRINCNGTIILVDDSRMGELAEILKSDFQKEKHIHEGFENFEDYIYAHASKLTSKWDLEDQEKRDVTIEIAKRMKDLL